MLLVPALASMAQAASVHQGVLDESVTLLRPGGGEVLAVGQQYFIQWQATGPWSSSNATVTLVLHYVVGSTSKTSPILSDGPNTGSCSWTPAVESTSSRIEIRIRASGNVAVALSPGTFSIVQGMPKVESTTEDRYKDEVDVNTPIAIEFSQAMNRTSAQTAFTISPWVEGSFTWGGATRMTFTPKGSLTSGTSYAVKVSRDAQALTGLKMSSDFTMTVKTKSAPKDYSGVWIALLIVCGVAGGFLFLKFGLTGMKSAKAREPIERKPVSWFKAKEPTPKPEEVPAAPVAPAYPAATGDFVTQSEPRRFAPTAPTSPSVQALATGAPPEVRPTPEPVQKPVAVQQHIEPVVIPKETGEEPVPPTLLAPAPPSMSVDIPLVPIPSEPSRPAWEAAPTTETELEAAMEELTLPELTLPVPSMAEQATDRMSEEVQVPAEPAATETAPAFVDAAEMETAQFEAPSEPTPRFVSSEESESLSGPIEFPSIAPPPEPQHEIQLPAQPVPLPMPSVVEPTPPQPAATPWTSPPPTPQWTAQPQHPVPQPQFVSEKERKKWEKEQEKARKLSEKQATQATKELEKRKALEAKLREKEERERQKTREKEEKRLRKLGITSEQVMQSEQTQQAMAIQQQFVQQEQAYQMQQPYQYAGAQPASQPGVEPRYAPESSVQPSEPTQTVVPGGSLSPDVAGTAEVAPHIELTEQPSLQPYIPEEPPAGVTEPHHEPVTIEWGAEQAPELAASPLPTDLTPPEEGPPPSLEPIEPQLEPPQAQEPPAGGSHGQMEMSPQALTGGAVITCPQCQALNRSGDKQCRVCATPLEQAPEGPLQPPPLPGTEGEGEEIFIDLTGEEPQAPEGASVFVCPTCGIPLPPDSRYCESCGTKIR